MYILTCLTYLSLTFPLFTSEASNFTLPNIQDTNITTFQESILDFETLSANSTVIANPKNQESTTNFFTSSIIEDYNTVAKLVISTPESQSTTTVLPSTVVAEESKLVSTVSPQIDDVNSNTRSSEATTEAFATDILKDILLSTTIDSADSPILLTKLNEAVNESVNSNERSVESASVTEVGKRVETEIILTNVMTVEPERRDSENILGDNGAKNSSESLFTSHTVQLPDATKSTENFTHNIEFQEATSKSKSLGLSETTSEITTPKPISYLDYSTKLTRSEDLLTATSTEETLIKITESEDETTQQTESPVISIGTSNHKFTSIIHTPKFENGIQTKLVSGELDETINQKELELSLTAVSDTDPSTSKHYTTSGEHFIPHAIPMESLYPYKKKSAEPDSKNNSSTYSDVVSSIVADSSSIDETVTSFDEPFEQNAILTTDIDTFTDRSQNIVVGHKCTRIFQESILWNVTDGGMLALKSCPPGYQGNMYRPCFSNGKWGNVDYSECRLEHLGRMRHMIFHQVQKGMIGNMYVLADEFSKYISSVDMKSPMDRLEAFEILNTFLKLDLTLKMDKSRDIKYVQTLLYSCNELIKKKTVLFSPGSQKNKLITEKAVEMIFDLTSFAEKALRGLLKTQKKQIAFRSTSNVVLYLYRGKLSRQFHLMNFSNEFERDDELSSYFNLEKTLERSAYALIWIKGLHELLSTENFLVNSDVAVATILSPLNSLNHMVHPPTFDIGLRLRKEIPCGYRLKCGQLWNMSHLWNTDDCIKATRKEDIVTCRCHHLGSISLLLEELPQTKSIGPSPPVGKLITVSCVTSLSATLLTLVINFLIRRRDQSLSIFILINLLVCLAAIQVAFMLGVNKTESFEVCLLFAVLLHYLFLVSCFWVVSYSIYLLRRLRSCMEYIGRIRDYCAISWLLPTVFLIISFVGNPNEYETKQFCWLNVQKGILWSFVVPVTTLILVNTIVMIMALKIFQDQMSVTHKLEICKTRNSMRAGVTLLPYFAINWFFGILAVENSDSMILQVVFSFTNSVQGILTFVFFCIMDSNVQMLFRLKFHDSSKKTKVSAMRLRKSGSFPIMDRPLMTLTDDSRRHDCTPLLCDRSTYHESPEDPCCSNIRV